MIIANQVGAGLGMGTDDNAVIVLSANAQTSLSKAAKPQLARQLIHLIAKEYAS